MTISIRRIPLVAAVLLCATLGSAAGQTTDTRLPPLTIRSMDGRDLYQFYCASCHGSSGRGDGPTARMLKVPPADLTTIARRNGGKFPTQAVEAFVSHEEARPTAAHGTRQMPVWGPIFRALDPSDTRVRMRIANVVAYLETIQAR